MLHATRTPNVRFVQAVGVAPSTTTMQLGAASLPPRGVHAIPHATPEMIARIQEGCCDDCSCPGCSACTPVNIARARALGSQQGYYMPYATPANLKGQVHRHHGFGLINESDAWLTGRPYGLPGTAAITYQQGPDGRYTAELRDASDGDPNTDNYAPIDPSYSTTSPIQDDDSSAALWIIAGAQRSAQKSLHKMAFWTSLLGGLTVGTIAAAIVTGVVARRRG